MANHVSGHFRHKGLNPTAQKVWDEYVVGKLDEAVKRMSERKEEESWRFHEVHLGNYLFEEKDGEFVNWDFNQMCEEIGAKWAYATEWDEDYVNVYSAWSPVVEWCEMVAKAVGEADSEAEFILTYEDEMPNFVGVASFTKYGIDDQSEIDYDEIREKCINDHAELAEMWDEDLGDWQEDKEEEANELLWELQHDVIHEWQEGAS